MCLFLDAEGVGQGDSVLVQVENWIGLLFHVGDTQRFDYVPESRLFPRFQNPP